MPVAMTFTADGQKALREIAKLEAKITTLTAKLRGVGVAGGKASAGVQKVGKAIPSKAISSVVNFAAGFVSLAAGVAAARAAFQDFRDAQDKAASRVTTVEGARSQLAQVATSKADFKKLIGQGDVLRKTQGIGAIRAFQIAFEARSAELDTDAHLALFGSLTRIKFDPLAGISAIQKIQANFGGTGSGRTGGGTSRQIINKVLAAAQQSPVVAPKIAQALSTSAVEFAAIGGQDEALLAMLSPLSKTFESPKLASQRIKSLSAAILRRLPEKELQQRGIKKRGFDLITSIPELIEAGKLPGQGGKPATDKFEFLGAAEAVAGLDAILAAEKEIRKVLVDVRAAEAGTRGAQDILSKRIGIVQSDPQIQASRNRRIAQQQLHLLEEGGLGVTTLQMDTLVDRAVLKQRKQEASGFAVGAFKVATNVGRFVLGDEGFADFVGFDKSARQADLLKADPVDVQGGSNRTEPAGAGTTRVDAIIGKLERSVDGLAEAGVSMSGGPTLRRPDEDI